MTKRIYQNARRIIVFACAVLMSLPPVYGPGAMAQECIDIADRPMNNATAGAAANIFFLLDDSGSMDWEYSCPETDGKLPRQANSGQVAYLYDNDDNNYSTGETNGRILGVTHDSRDYWKATFGAYNRLYYDPKNYYEPWIQVDGTPLANADPDNPRTRPLVGTPTTSSTNTRDNQLRSTDSRWYKNMSDEWWTFEGETILVPSGDSFETTFDSHGDSPTNPSSSQCGKWVRLTDSPITYESGISGAVRIARTGSNLGTYTRADAIRFVTDAESSNENAGIIVDNDNDNNDSNSNYTEYRSDGSTDGDGLVWDGNSNARYSWPGGGYGDRYGSRYTNDYGRYAEWTHTFTSSDAGAYHVETWVGCRSDSDRDVDFTIRSVTQETVPDIVVPYSHYYTFEDLDGDKEWDEGVEDVWLVLLNQDGTASYYRASETDGSALLLGTDNADDNTMTRAQLTEVEESVVASSHPTILADSYNDNWPSGYTARQNFANWYEFYRRRWMTSVYAISKSIAEFSGVYIGMAGINALTCGTERSWDLRERVVPVGVNGVNRGNEILTKLFQFDHGQCQNTPLRRGYEEMAQYFETTSSNDSDLGASPINDPEAGQCQMNFAIVFTDGYYNGGDPDIDDTSNDNIDGTTIVCNGVTVSGIGPFADGEQRTLADLAMRYYAWDLAPDMADMVPVFTGTPKDWVTHQHLKTYTVAFGVTGRINPDNVVVELPEPLPGGASASDYVVIGDPPNPYGQNFNNWSTSGDEGKIDDLLHAAVNGRGEFYSAKSSAELVNALLEIAGSINEHQGTGARATASSNELVSGTMMFQVGFKEIGWAGKFSARDLETASDITDSIDCSNPTGSDWCAHILLEERVEDSGHTDRQIATFNGLAGSAFASGSIGPNEAELTADYDALDDAGLSGADLVAYLRGDKTNEERNDGIFRNRMTPDTDDGTIPNMSFTMGDIVHSSATYDPETNMVYVGANDGFLHAFDTATGQEQFAYAPSFVVPNMKYLSQPDYEHKFFVDETPVLQNTGTSTLLAGGLGKGGKGIYCLDVTTPASNTQSNASSWVKWEFPRTDTQAANVGYTYGQPYIVQTRSTDHPWVVVFSNGYASPNERAVLFVLDAFDGTIVREIDTQVGDCNGLSNLIVTDPDGDNIADYVYAGDLKGNMWKFDLTDENSNLWDVAYKNGSTPAPLFTTSDPDGNPQPITAKPDVMNHCDPSKPGYIVVFGTGKFLGLSDLGDGSSPEQTQTIYGIWDFGDDDDDSEYLGAFNRSGSTVTNFAGLHMMEQTITVNGNSGSVSCDEACWATEGDDDPGEEPDPNPNSNTTGCLDSNDQAVAATAGWYMDLPAAGERVVFEPMIVEGAAYILSLAPNATSTACSAGGSSGVYIVNACSGGCNLPAYESQDTSGTPGENTYDYDASRTVYDRDGNEVELEGGGGTTPGPGGTTPASAPNVTIGNAGVGGTMLFDPATGQYLYIVTESDGRLSQPVPTVAGKLGLIYWRVVD